MKGNGKKRGYTGFKVAVRNCHHQKEHMPYHSELPGWRKKFIIAKKAAFLSAFAQVGVIGAASKKSKVNRRAHFRWMKSDPAYAAAFAVAEDRAIEVMETEARRRAVKGTVKPVFWKGERCGGIREFSDLLMIFLLKAKRPAVYRENPRQAGDSTDRLAELFSAKAAGPVERGETP